MKKSSWIEHNDLMYSRKPNKAGKYIEGMWGQGTAYKPRTFRIVRLLTLEQLPEDVRARL